MDRIVGPVQVDTFSQTWHQLFWHPFTAHDVLPIVNRGHIGKREVHYINRDLELLGVRTEIDLIDTRSPTVRLLAAQLSGLQSPRS